MQKKYRLNNSRVFHYLYKRGSSVSNRRLVLIYAPSKFHLRVGFVVSKKIGKAVVRNKVRRRMREAFRSMIGSAADHYNYVLVARPEIALADYRQIKQSIESLLRRAELYREPSAKDPSDDRSEAIDCPDYAHKAPVRSKESS